MFVLKIKTHLQVYLLNIVPCFGITQDPNSKDYMMILPYCDGNMRKYLNESENCLSYESKIRGLLYIANGLLRIHNVEKVHKDLHSGNILFNSGFPIISDLGLCQPVNNGNQSVDNEGVYGVLPYMAPEILRGYQFTKAADIYSFGIIMNEYLSEGIPYGNIPHDHVLAIKICKGIRPKISEDTPKLLTELIIKCWDVNAENRPTAREIRQILKKWNDESYNKSSEIYSQIKECEKTRKDKLKNNSSKKKPIIKTHPQATYTSRLLNFK